MCSWFLILDNLHDLCLLLRAFKARHDEKAVSREFQEGEPVYYRNFSGRGNRNLPGVITENLSGKGYVIRDINENKVVRRHPDHIFRGGNLSPPTDIAETVVQYIRSFWMCSVIQQVSRVVCWLSNLNQGHWGLVSLVAKVMLSMTSYNRHALLFLPVLQLSVETMLD